MDTLIAGYGKATRLTGWVPRVKLDDGLRQTVRWISQHLERYKPGVYNV